MLYSPTLPCISSIASLMPFTIVPVCALALPVRGRLDTIFTVLESAFLPQPAPMTAAPAARAAVRPRMVDRRETIALAYPARPGVSRTVGSAVSARRGGG